MSGDVYVAFSSWLNQKKSFVGKGTLGSLVSHDSNIEIDDIVDFKIVELAMKDLN